MTMNISSPAFTDGGRIPERHTCDGDDISPALEWSGIPEGAQTLALVCDDPDAPMGTWVHWVVFNLPADTTGLPENVLPERNLDNGAMQGMNDFRKVGYGGPCPPSGEHRYFFKLFALDAALPLEAGASKSHLMIAMEGHILEQAVLMGRYRR